jgi:hypothetical protein
MRIELRDLPEFSNSELQGPRAGKLLTNLLFRVVAEVEWGKRRNSEYEERSST